MKQFVAAGLIMGTLALTGCVATAKKSDFALQGPAQTANVMTLEYTSVGLTNEYKLGAWSGSLKRTEASVGLGYHVGTKNVNFTIANQTAANQREWKAQCESKKQGAVTTNISVDFANPYACTVTQNGRQVGEIVLEQPKLDASREALKFVGLDKIAGSNLKLKGALSITGREYQIEPVLTDNTGETHSSPIGYQVTYKDQVIGQVAVKTSMTGQTHTFWLAPGLSEEAQYRVLTGLMAAGMAVG